MFSLSFEAKIKHETKAQPHIIIESKGDDSGAQRNLRTVCIGRTGTEPDFQKHALVKFTID